MLERGSDLMLSVLQVGRKEDRLGFMGYDQKCHYLYRVDADTGEKPTHLVKWVKLETRVTKGHKRVNSKAQTVFDELFIGNVEEGEVWGFEIKAAREK